MVKYPIVEIFHSVQGEGFHCGIPHVFVRFGNCNLRCEWCDTDFLVYEERELDSIVAEVLSYGCDRVIFTGGEPGIQDLSTIGRYLKEHGLYRDEWDNRSGSHYRLDLRESEGPGIPERRHQTEIRRRVEGGLLRTVTRHL